MESTNLPTELSKPAPSIARGLVLLAFAAMLGLCGLCASLFYLIIPFTARPNVESNLLLGVVAGIGILFGATLAWQSILVWRGREPGTMARALPPFGIFLGAFFVAVLAGVGVQNFKPTATLPVVLGFPVLHFIAATTPVFAVIAYAARRLGKASSSRTAFFALTWGAFGATTIAIVVEAFLGILFLALAVMVILAQPAGAAQLGRLQRVLETVTRTNDFALLTQWLANPFVIAGILFYFALLVPLIEEAFKTLVLVPLNSPRTLAREAILWGICAGAGFALLENLFNGITANNDWGVVILMRAGTATMHIANGAWMGRGWYAALVERRWGQLVQAYGLCVVAHAVWNGAALVMSGGALVLNASAAIVPASVLVGAMATILVILTVLALISLVYLVRRFSV